MSSDASFDDTFANLEAERRRIAALIDTRLVNTLNLLLAQASAYEQTLTDPQARMAIAVLASLVRRAQQQVRDLATELHPTTLETLGLEPALEVLAQQIIRSHGLAVSLSATRLPERLPARVELALFRIAQHALDRAVYYARASQVSITLRSNDDELLLHITDNGIALASLDELDAACAHMQQFGASSTCELDNHGALTLAVRVPMITPASLTPREIDVLRCLAEGLSNRIIAERLTISARTVNFHLDNVYSKLGVHSRAEAMLYALQHGVTWHDPG